MNETNRIWQDTIEALIDPSYGMDEEEETDYLNKIMAKLKSGKDLTSEELNYLTQFTALYDSIACKI